MHLSIREIKQRKDELAKQEIHCPKCGNRQYACYDRVYTLYVGKCIDCTNDISELARHGRVITDFIESL